MNTVNYLLYKRALYEPVHLIGIPDTYEYSTVPVGELSSYLQNQNEMRKLRAVQEFNDIPTITGTTEDSLDENTIFKRLKKLYENNLYN